MGGVDKISFTSIYGVLVAVLTVGSEMSWALSI